MKSFVLAILAASLLVVIPAPCLAAQGQVSASDAIYQAHVSSVTLDPEVFYPYETGTIDVELTNSGNQTVSLAHPDILDTHVKVLNPNSYNSVVRLGPGNVMKYSFQIEVDALDGTYFPIFTVSTKESGSISYPFKLEVDSRNLTAGITDRPDNFSMSKKDTVNFSLANPRNAPLTNIMVTVSGEGTELNPSQKFISSLNAGTSIDIPFKVTPSQDTDLMFHVSYQNGNNVHNTEATLPIKLEEDKTGVIPVINNVALTSQGNAYLLSGDINNAGITDAKAMILSVETPAKGVTPYQEYAIGSLAADDFSSFKLTFTTNDLSSVPVKVQWKDSDGNTFTSIEKVNLRDGSNGASNGNSNGGSGSSGSSTGQSSSSSMGPGGAGGPPGGGGIFSFGGTRGGGLSSFYPVIAAGIIIVAAIVLWKKRKWLKARFRKS